MKVFISWSKPKSRHFGLALRDWLPEVVQSIDPWMSSEDIDKGQRWAAEIGGKLADLGQGILCVTNENIGEPWLNFEAGALAKTLDDARVRPVLFDLHPSDVTGPLAQFQATIATDRDDMYKLVASLNEACAAPLDSLRLERAFTRNWDDLANRLQAIRQVPSKQKVETRRTTEDVLGELLERVRDLQRTLTHDAKAGLAAEVDDWPEPARSKWPVDTQGNELKPGELVTVRGELAKIESIDRKATGWVAAIRTEKDNRRLIVSDISRLQWAPF